FLSSRRRHTRSKRVWSSDVCSSDLRTLTSSLSLQMHHHRAEHWVVVSGTARVTRGEEVRVLSENESTYIPIETKHRLENVGKERSEERRVGKECEVGRERER